ncbi:neoverrucotoxin subunit beta-like [Cheilinus undulatus]|uniref:neoverrucotoxin subunit beta-like n=1 Tax=Cheilinus undulatus TaxID=241271 RepID=UPI001BD6DF2D|nr:neoverrucotoxin subunit beta-like [Cheilinus undulatus]
MDSENINFAALGRPFTMGMLYDARKDELITGLTLWHSKDLEENTVETPHSTSSFKVSASDSIESKSSLMDINASLEASFMSGLVKVEGSAHYLNNTKKFKNQSRVICQYNVTTCFKQLSLADLGTLNKEQIERIKKGFATHVVAGILYGANAFFVFDSEKLDSSTTQEIQGSMEAVIKKIPSFDVGGKVDIKLTDEEKKLTNKFSCKFYGDLTLESNPTTFEEAVNTYAELPKLIREKKENCIPQKVWLLPLKDLESSAAQLQCEISQELLREVQDALEDLTQVGMRVNEAMDDEDVKRFPPIQGKLHRFQNLCDSYVSDIKRVFAEKLPLIREGEEDEKSVKQMLEDRAKSPFSHERLSKWMDGKEKEINVIKFCLAIMKGAKPEIKVVPNQSAVEKAVLKAGSQEALCYVFTSLHSPDSGLEAIADFLDSAEKENAEEDPWYYSETVVRRMRSMARFFKSVQFPDNYSILLITSIADENHKGATIYRLKEGILKPEPEKRDLADVNNRGDFAMYFIDVTLDPDTANQNLTVDQRVERSEARYGPAQMYRDLPQRFDDLPQILCKEGLTGCCYWEVGVHPGMENTSVGVCYKGIPRKGEGDDAKLGKVKEELQQMESLGVISRVSGPTDWCAGMVVAPKKDSKKVCLCVDLTGINQYVCREKFIPPSVEQSLGTLAGAKLFSKLDANMGFWQIPLSEESAKNTTFITLFGRFHFNRLPFGIASAPEHFQCMMAEVTEGLDGVVCHIDDLLVWGRDQEEHDARLHAVLKSLEKAGITLNMSKCELSKSEVVFLGHVISAAGIRPDPRKTEAIMELKEPSNVSEVRSFLGMVNQLGKFTPQLAEKDKPLCNLLSKKNCWVWETDQARAFETLKKALSSPPVLAMYDPNRDTKVSKTMASLYTDVEVHQDQNLLPQEQFLPLCYQTNEQYPGPPPRDSH